ncbi:MAG: chromate efflux transporter [Pseudoxanthomonas sp.]|nr:chromate efflux transporter [Pseudoxanthomonas sp.]
MTGVAGGTDAAPPAPERIGLAAAAAVWLKIGLLGFGGPAGQIALMHRELVERRRWLGERRFLHALNYCMLLPGPEAMQLATYVGWLMHRTLGGIVAGTLFVLPGLLVIVALAVLYVQHGQLAPVAAVFAGLKAAVLAIVVQAVLRIGGRVLHGPRAWLLAAAAFLALAVFSLPFPLVVAGAALVGLAGWLPARPSAHGAPAGDREGLVDRALREGRLGHTVPSRGRALRTLAIWLPVWWLPVLAVVALTGSDSVLTQMGLLFSQIAVLGFGGAYAVLAWVGQAMVETSGWLSTGQMLDGLALAETTPGPLVLVLPFVGFLVAHGHETALASPLLAGLAGALLVAWVTFVPCLLWIFLGGPWVEAIRANRRVSAALAAVTAAVVGVILNLALWFALNVLFAQQGTVGLAGLEIAVPVPASLDPVAAGLVALAFVLVFALRAGLLVVLSLMALAGLLANTLL